jgi:hypothetical protein
VLRQGGHRRPLDRGRRLGLPVPGPFVVTHGRTLFFDLTTGETQAEFDNVWVLRFGPDGRCAEFHEWFAGRREHDPTRA